MIEKVGYTRPATASRVGSKRKTSESSSVSFSDLLDGLDGASQSATAESANAALPLSGANVLLGLQEVSEDEMHQRKAFKQGKSAIDALDSLRDSLLTGRLSSSTIRQLESIVAEERAKTNDPKLNAILDDIDVRVAVELAKLDRISS